MAAAFVQIDVGGFNTSSSSFTVTLNSGITAGNFVVVAGMFDSAATSVTISNGSADAVTDSGLGIITDGTVKTFVKAFLAPTAGTTTFTATYSGTNPGFGDLFVWEISGLTSPIFDKKVHGTGTGTAIASGTTGTLSSATEAGIAYAESSDSVTTAAGSGWTRGQGSTVGSNTGDGVAAPNTASGGEHRVISATTAINGTFTNNSNVAWVAWVATFMAGGAVSVPEVPQARRRGARWHPRQGPTSFLKPSANDDTPPAGSDIPPPCCGGAYEPPDRPQYIGSLYSWAVAASLALTALPCGESATANPARAVWQDVSSAPYNTALLTPVEVVTDYLPCVVTGWSIPDGPLPTNRDWIGTGVPEFLTATVPKPFTQADQSNPRAGPVTSRDWTATISRSLFVKPPLSNYDWPLPPRPQSGQSYTQNLSLALSAKPPTNSNWQLPRGSQLGQAFWAGQAPPVAVAVKPPAASCWALPLRLAPTNTSWVQTPQQVAAAVVSYLPCVVTGWAPPDTPFQPRRDWFTTRVADAPLTYSFRDPFLATRLTLQYDRKVHSQTQPNQTLTILSAPPVFYDRPCQVVISGVNDPPPAGRSWINAPGPLLIPPNIRRTFDYPLPKQPPVTNRDWINTGAGRTPPAGIRPPTRYSWPLPIRVADTNRDWIGPDSVIRRVPTVTPPGATPGGGGLGFSYQRYERILEELYKKKKKLPRKAKKALAKAIVVVEKIDTSAADLARLLQALEAAAATSTQNTLASINAANALAEQARLILEQQRLRQLREEDDLILMMLDGED